MVVALYSQAGFSASSSLGRKWWNKKNLYTSGIEVHLKNLFRAPFPQSSTFISLAKMITWPLVAARDARKCNGAPGYIVSQSRSGAVTTDEGEDRQWVGRQKCLWRWTEVWMNNMNIVPVWHDGFNFFFFFLAYLGTNAFAQLFVVRANAMLHLY